MPSEKMAPEGSGEPWCSSTITPANVGWALITGGRACGFSCEPIIAWRHKIALDGAFEVERVTVHGTNGVSFGGFAIEKPPGAPHRCSIRRVACFETLEDLREYWTSRPGR